MQCKNCGKEFLDDEKFCGGCGLPREASENPVQIRCPHCGGVMTKQTKFCTLCGQPLVAAAPQEPAAPAKKSKKPLWIAIICVFLAVVVSVGAYLLFRGHEEPTADETYKRAIACYDAGDLETALELFEDLGNYRDCPEMVELIRDKLASLTQPVETEPAQTQPGETQPVETEPVTEPVEKAEVELVVKQAELVYELTDADVELFYTMLAESETLAMDTEDVDAAVAASEELDAQFEYLQAQQSIAMVLYYCDLENEAASQLYLDATEMITQANNDYIEMARRVYQSDSPAKERLFEEWTEQELQMLMAYTPEIMELQQRNSEIEVAYQDIKYGEDLYDGMVPLYLEMVSNNNRMAQIFGYENFYEYAYADVYSRDYTTDQVQQLRQYAAEYLTDAMFGSMIALVETMEQMGTMDQYLMFSYMEEHYTSFEEVLTGYLAAVPESLRQETQGMFNGNVLMFEDSQGVMEGAFTTNIGMDRAICYYGPGYSDIFTIVHEAGHYYGAMYTYLDDIPLDLAETQSQGNEWLLMSYLENELSPEVYSALVDYRTFSDMASIMMCLLVDEFEYRVYSHPDVASLTGDDLDAIMEEVCQAYGGSELLSNALSDIQTYWRMVVVEQPVYYISYAVSALASMDLYNVAKDDFAQACRIYTALNENVDLELGFLGNIQAAGLRGPFDEELYVELYERYN